MTRFLLFVMLERHRGAARTPVRAMDYSDARFAGLI